MIMQAREDKAKVQISHCTVTMETPWGGETYPSMWICGGASDSDVQSHILSTEREEWQNLNGKLWPWNGIPLLDRKSGPQNLHTTCTGSLLTNNHSFFYYSSLLCSFFFCPDNGSSRFSNHRHIPTRLCGVTSLRMVISTSTIMETSDLIMQRPDLLSVHYFSFMIISIYYLKEKF